ncbi:HigA family addiction module antitoxin [Dinghuibacter silviterrae]|uniref:Addiction module HigA family antidote n=1 Tax=Dinghuibacter silviterrae TaxID=1539049 RepID=A0A4R8DU59_9BACT|nr:HigA family addiction module antitoxin [Dinghuibacter silviterrae]TDX01679.1 addiction module HigA family antidote [Dinghuibacter silviterrae]
MENQHVIVGTNKQIIHSPVAVHPGEILKDEIEARKLVKMEVAKSLGIQPGHLSELFKGKRNISPLLALKLQHLLDISAETWLRLQNSYDLTILRSLMAKDKTRTRKKKSVA